MPELPNLEAAALLPMLQHAFEGFALATPDPWRVVYANPSVAKWLNRCVSGMRDARLDEIFAIASQSELLESIDNIWRGNATGLSLNAFLQSDDECDVPIHVRLCRITLGSERLLGLVMQKGNDLSFSSAVMSDRRDPLTGLPDRTFLHNRLAAMLEGDRSADRQCAVLFVDLNNFKQINDRHGHLLGDRVLCEVARRLTSCVREGDYVTRYGGDEFVVLLQNVSGPDEIEPVIERVRSALADPIVLPEGQFMLSLSVGVAVAEPHHLSPEDVLSEADRRMYEAKRAGV